MANTRTIPKKRKPAAAKPAAAADAATASGSQADYDAFLPAAKRVAAADIITMRADPQLALHNLQVGVGNVLAEAARVAKLPETSRAELASLEPLALAVIFSSTQLTKASSPNGLAEQLARGMALRALLLKTADALVLAGLLPQAAVAKIRAGYGKLDAARDLVALTALFARHQATLRGKHAISSAELQEAAAVGTALLKVLKPGRARRAATAPAVGADERDRLWTMLVAGHDRLWRAGAYLFGRHAVAAKVPALQASRAPRSQKAPATATARAAEPA